MLLIYAAISFAASLTHFLSPRATRLRLVDLGVDPNDIVVPDAILQQATWTAISGTLLAILLAVGTFGLFASAGWARSILRGWAVLTVLRTAVLLLAAYLSVDTAAAFQYRVQTLQREALTASGTEIPPNVLDRDEASIRETGTRRLAAVGLLPAIVPAIILLAYRRPNAG